jgi:hypothetical protein
MHDEPEPLNNPPANVMPESHRRILVIMAVMGAGGAVVAGIVASWLHGVGLLIGLAIAFANYFWLKYSLRKIFENTPEGEKPRISAIRYMGRYLALGAVIAIIYVSAVIPIIPVILGIAGFGFAVVADGLIRIFSSFSNRKEI